MQIRILFHFIFNIVVVDRQPCEHVKNVDKSISLRRLIVKNAKKQVKDR
jgi:hypothetical protein